jgi:RsiW-degrading membrane proteinase PrsW (M82 family)
MGRGERIRAGIIGCAIGGVALIALAFVVMVVVASVPDAAALGMSAVAACIPALVYAGIVLRLDRYESEPKRNIIACIAWGAVGAILFSLLGGLFFQTVIAGSFGADVADVASIVIGAPLIEESFKGIAVLALLFVARDEIDSTLDGLVYGALIGVGFAMTENILYFGQAYLEGGIREFGVLVLGRAVLGGFGHPAYTAVTGAAIGWARCRYGQGILRLLAPVAGWAVAVGLHVAWNGGLLLTSALLGEGASLLTVVTIQALLVIVPAVLVLQAIARMSAEHELAILRAELRGEVARGTLTETEYQTIVDGPRRQRSLALAGAKGGRALRARQKAFFDTAAEIAFRSHHARRGEVFGSGNDRDDRDRQRLRTLRNELAASGIALGE